MDSESFRLGNENLWAWLVRLLSKQPEWLRAKVRFFLPTVDLDCSHEAPNPVVTHHQLNRLFAQGPATWESFIYTLCLELDVPLELEVPLLSIWGQREGKGSHGTVKAASTALWPGERQNPHREDTEPYIPNAFGDRKASVCRAVRRPQPLDHKTEEQHRILRDKESLD